MISKSGNYLINNLHTLFEKLISTRVTLKPLSKSDKRILRSSNWQPLIYKFTWLILLFIISFMNVGSAASNQRAHTAVIPAVPTPISIIIPSCRKYPCVTSTKGSVMPGIRPYIDTENNIHLFQSFDYNISNQGTVAKHYDFVWGAQVDHVQAIRSDNPNIFISYYIPFHRDSGIFGNQDARQDLNYWKTVHSDWILYKCDRVTPAYEYGDPNIPLDFKNSALISWQIQTYALPASQAGYDAIAADNVGLQNLYGACGVYINGKWVQHYTGKADDPEWRADILNWVTQMQEALHHLRHPLALIANLAWGDLSPSDDIVQQLVNHLDGVLDEEGFTHGGQGYLTDQEWVQKIQFMENVQAQGKSYYLVNQFPTPSVSRDQIQWALASYLMGKENAASIFISSYQQYGADTRYKEYSALIGSPMNYAYEWQKVYWRNYTNGLSIVNPSSTETYIVTIKMQRHYMDLYGNLVAQTVTLSPHSGIVLLYDSSEIDNLRR